MDKLPIPSIKNSSREEFLKAFETFNNNKAMLDKLYQKNKSNYTDFIIKHKEIIKKHFCQKNKVYKVVKQGGWYWEARTKLEPLIKYVFIISATINRKNVLPCEFVPYVVAIPLDENGNLIKFVSCMEDCILYEHGENIAISHLSEEDYPDICEKYKQYLREKSSDDFRQYNK